MPEVETTLETTPEVTPEQDLIETLSAPPTSGTKTLRFKDDPEKTSERPVKAGNSGTKEAPEPASKKEEKVEAKPKPEDPYAWAPDKQRAALLKATHEKNPFVDISTDSGKKLLERLTDNQQTYDQLSKRIKELEAKQAPPPEEKRETAPVKEKEPEKEPLPPPPHRVLMEKWSKEPDPLKALYAEELEAYQNEDNRRLANVHNAMWEVRFLGMGLPMIQEAVINTVKQMFQQELGDLLPALRADKQHREEIEDMENARTELKSEDEYRDFVDKMFSVAEDNPELEYNGKKFSNTLFNQILIENPEIAKILEQDSDPRKARRATIQSRLRSAIRLYRLKSKAEEQPQVATAEAKALLESAAKAEADRREEDRIRQAVTRSGQTDGPGEKPGDDYIDRLVRSGTKPSQRLGLK